MRWLTQMQGTPIELGGFRGRTNKLVDGCYSWWVGVAVVLVEGLLETGTSAGSSAEGRAAATHQEDAWDDVDGEFLDGDLFVELIITTRLAFQSSCSSGVYSLCWATSCRWPEG